MRQVLLHNLRHIRSLSFTPVLLDARSFELSDLLWSYLHDESFAFYFSSRELVECAFSILLLSILYHCSFVGPTCTVPINSA